MHAALISLVLMSGACGEPAPGDVTVSLPPISAPVNYAVATDGCNGCGCCVPGNYRACKQYQASAVRTAPACQTNYHPAFYFCHRMFLHPANWTQDYNYRERFDYPWNDPRCRCASPPIGY
jgi:hypothetical protein